MSQWTHIRGGFELRSLPYEYKGKNPDTHYGSKDAYLPFPDEQMKLDPPTPVLRDKDKEKVGLSFEVSLYSLPRAKKYIEEAFKMLPYGETGWLYSISQQRYNSSMSSSSFDYPCEKKQFEKMILQMYDPEKIFSNYKEFSHYYNMSLNWISYVTGIVIGVREDIRHCSGDELLEALEKFFLYLREHEIYVEDGYLEWDDEYISEYRYAWRSSRVFSDDVYSFMKIDKKTNKIIWKKTYNYPTIVNDKGRKVKDYFAQELITTVWEKESKKK